MAASIDKRVFRAGNVLSPDSKWTGEEPDWHGWESWPIEKFMNTRMRMLGFYTYYLSEMDLRPDLVTWMKASGKYSKEQLAMIKSAPPAEVMLFTASKLARAITRGMPGLHPNAQEFYDKKFLNAEADPEERVIAKDDSNIIRDDVNHALSVLAAKAKPETLTDGTATKPTKVKQNPQLLLRKKTDKTIITYLEEMMDSWGASTVVAPLPSLLSLIRDNNTPAAGCLLVQRWLEKNLGEYQKAYIDQNSDEAEGFEYLGKRALNSRVKAFEKMLEDTAKCTNQKKALRKPRVKKVKDATKQVSRLKFQVDSKDFGLTSVAPTRIPCAFQVIAFNTKYRTLSFYQASGPAGFEVKGSGLKGFCVKESFTTTLRKPEKMLSTLLGSTPNKLAKHLEGLTTKRRVPNGRFNEQTIILRVIDKKSL